MSADMEHVTKRSRPSIATPGVSYWVFLVLAGVLIGYSVATPWKEEARWPVVFSMRNDAIGDPSFVSRGVDEFALWAGLYVAGVIALVGLALLARLVRLPRRHLILLGLAGLIVGIGGLAGAFLDVAESNAEISESYFGVFADWQRSELISAGAEVIPANGLNNAVIALPLAAVPIGLLLGIDGPRLVAGLGAVLSLAAFAVPWRSATALHADGRLEYHDFWFMVYSEQFSWLLLVGVVVFGVILLAMFWTRGAAQTILGVGSIIYFLVLFAASFWIDEYQPGEDQPIENALSDAAYVHTRVPVWPEVLTLLLTGIVLLFAAAMWRWRTTARR